MSKKFKGGNIYKARMQGVVAELVGTQPTGAWQQLPGHKNILVRGTRRGVEIVKISPEEEEELPF